MAASWECPSLPVISLPLKETSKASFLALKPLISSMYEQDAESFNDEIRQLNQLREHASKPSRDYTGCNVLRRYYAQLHLLRARFPPESAQIVIDFVWKDVYTGKETCKEGLMIDQAAILYNIGALHSLVGGRDNRQTEQEMKEALTHFQCSAGAFAYLSEHFASNGCQDLSPQLIDMYCNLLLGQAQECLVEKSLKGLTKVKNLSISRVAMKVAEYYQSVLLVLESDIGTAAVKKYKDWPKLLQIKSIYYTSIAHLYQANSLEEQNNFGFMIAFQQLALQKLQSIGKIPKGLPDVVKEAVKNLQEFLTSKLHESRKQNDQVYHELVPDLDSLEPAQGAELVKPVMFQPADRKATGSDIFARLIPMKAYEAASVFSEEKAKILRSILSSVDTKNDELENFLQSLNAEEISNLSSDPPALPADLLQQHQLFQGNEASIKALQKKLEDLMGMSQVADQQVQAMMQRRKEEQQEEKEFQERNGPRPESQVCAAIWKEVDSLYKYHQQAIKSNSDLKGMFNQHLLNLLLLCGPTSALKSAIPTLSLMDTPEDSGGQRFHEVMAKVDEMKRQRTMLVRQLREAMNTDDITRAMIGETSGNQDALIDDHMSKHRDHADIIRQNLAAQENILKALTEANAQQAKMRLTAQELTKRQQNWFISLAKSAGHFKFLQSKITEGMGFYSKLSESVERLHSRCMEVCNDRRKKRQNLERRASPTPQRHVAPPSAVPPEEASRPLDQGTPPVPPTGGQATPPVGSRPSRPPKKAEMRGEPLPPRTQSSVAPPSSADSMDSRTESVGSSVDSQSEVERMIQRLKDTQEQQQAVLGLPSIPITAGPQDSSSAQSGSMHTQPANAGSQPSPPDSHPRMHSTPDSYPIQPGLSSQLVPDPASHSQIPCSAPDSHSQIPPSAPDSHSEAPLAPSSHPQLPSDPSSHPQLALDPGSNPHVPNVIPDPHPPALVSVAAVQPSDGAADSSPLLPHMPPLLPLTPPLPDSGFVGTSVPQDSVDPSASNPSLSQPPSIDTSHTALLPSQLPSAFAPPVLVPQPSQSSSPPPAPSLPLSSQALPSSLQSQLLPRADATQQVLPPGIDTTPTHHPVGGASVLPHLTKHDDTPTSVVSITGSQPLGPPFQSSQSLGFDSFLEAPYGGTPGFKMDSQSSGISDGKQLISSGTQFPVESHSPPVLTTHPPPSLPGVHSLAIPQPAPSRTSALDTLDAFQLSKVALTDKQPFAPLPAQPLPPVSDVVPSPSLPSSLSLEPPSIPSMSLALPTGPLPNLSTSIPILSEPLSLSTLPLSTVPAPLSSLTQLHSGTLASLSSPSSHLEKLLLKQQETIQSQTRQIEEQKEQLRQQSREVSECRKEMEQFRLQHQLQEKDKLATTSNQSMLMQLLQSQQEMFSSQQGQVDKLSVVVDNERREHLEKEAGLQQRIAQEQAQNQSLQSQLAQQRKELEHYQQLALTTSQQAQATQTQAQQYLAQIQERDKVLASYRDEHKKIVENLEQQYRQRIQQLTQQIQELWSRKPGSSGAHPPLGSNLPPPMQPQQLSQSSSFGSPPEQSNSPSRPPHPQSHGGQTSAWVGGPQQSSQPLPAPLQPVSADAGHPSTAPAPTAHGGNQPLSQPSSTAQHPSFTWTPSGQQVLAGHGTVPPTQPSFPSQGHIPPSSQPPHPGHGSPLPASQPSYPGQGPSPHTSQPSFPGQGPQASYTGQGPQPSYTGQGPSPRTSQPSFPGQGPPPPTSQPSFPGQGPAPPTSQPSYAGQGLPSPASQPSFPGQGPPLPTSQPSFPGQGPPSPASQPSYPGQGPPPPASQPSFSGQGPPPHSQQTYSTQGQPQASQQAHLRQGQVPSNHPGKTQPPPGTPSQQSPHPVGRQGGTASQHHQQIRPQLQQTHSQTGQVGAPPQWAHIPQGQLPGMGAGSNPQLLAGQGPRHVNPSQGPTVHPMTPTLGPGMMMQQQPQARVAQQPQARVAQQPQFHQPQQVRPYLDPRTPQPMNVPRGGTGQPPLA